MRRRKRQRHHSPNKPPRGERTQRIKAARPQNDVGEALQTPGKPLDPEVRAVMEDRMGHDFGQVRVHADGKAAHSTKKRGAIAYTSGDDIVLGFEQDAVKTPPGQAILAHELAHTIQQGKAARVATNENSVLEGQADEAAGRLARGQRARVPQAGAAPAVQHLKVTRGGFGRALEEYTNIWRVPGQAVRLLRRAPAFMNIARQLDTHYVSRNDSTRFEPLQYDASGRITNGPRRLHGRRELLVSRNTSGARFLPRSSPDNILAGDVINLKGTDTPEFIQDIAHEAAHAVRFVTGTGPAPATLAATISAGIQDEISVRQTESNILQQIPSRRVRRAFRPVGSTVPAEVERDITPATGLTYLELFFFTWRLKEAQQHDGLTDDEASRIRDQVNAAPSATPFIFNPRPQSPGGLIGLSSYAQVWHDRVSAIRSWREFLQSHNRSDPDFVRRKEIRLLAHARRFFGGRVSYRPLP